jgi:thioredoxin reductase (NADPH)
MENLITVGLLVVLILVFAVPYWIIVARQKKRVETKHSAISGSQAAEPVTLHPKIDLLNCIGCGSCVEVCPEQVLGLVDGHAAIIHGSRCVGHALCEAVCPVSAITMGFGTPREGMEIPYYNDHFESNVPGLFIVGELGGVGLIRNAIRQAVTASETIAGRPRVKGNDEYDLIIVGGGPAGLAAALNATTHGLRYLLLEQESVGGSILHYPRKKLVLTQPVEMPRFGMLKGPEITKEELLEMFNSIISKNNLFLLEGQKVQSVERAEGFFQIRTTADSFRGAHVILAMGRRGTPKKLGVPGEALPKVMYKLLDAEQFHEQDVLVVGGGDSAVEAAIGLASQKGNRVTLSYRREGFTRLKDKNQKRIDDAVAAKKVDAIFKSNVSEITQTGVMLNIEEGNPKELKNDAVFIFAGGETPNEFLRKCGIKSREAEA